MAGIGNSPGCRAVDDALPLSVRELCHDLLESAATIRLLAQAAGAEAGPAVSPGSQLFCQLQLISATAGQIAEICADVLDECTSPADVLEQLYDPSANYPPRAARHEGGSSP